MELTLETTVTTRKVTVLVEDGIMVDSVHNKPMRITHLVLTYTIELDRWVSMAVTVYGFRLRGDGSVGRRADELLFGSPKYFPKWVAQAAEHYRPKEAAPLPPVPTCVLDVEDEDTKEKDA